MIEYIISGITYIQMQIEDFLGNMVTIVLDLDRDGIQIYRKKFGRKLLLFKHVKKVIRRSFSREQSRLDNFTRRYLKGLAYHLLRKRKPIGFEGQKLKETKNKGYLQDIFNHNDFSYFDYLQKLHHLNSHTGSFTLKDIFKAELGRIKEAIPQHSLWLERLEDPSLRHDIGIEDKRVPSGRQYLRLLEIVGKGLDSYFLQRRAECYANGLMGSPLKIWDRRFFRVYFTKDNQAGPYMKPKFKGNGYTNSSILDALWDLPDHFQPYNARLSDYTVFPNTFKKFIRGNGKDFIAFLSDAGPDSNENNQMILDSGKVPIIHARGNAVGEVIVTPNGHHFRGEYLLREIWPYLDKLHNARTAIERRFGLDYNYALTMMPHKGKRWAYIFIGMGEIMHQPNALTAYKIGELSLIRSSSAFRRIYSNFDSGKKQ